VHQPENSCGDRRSRGLSAAGFFAPFLLAAIGWLALPSGGHAQGLGSDPTQLLQQLGRGGLGGGLGALGGLSNGVVDTTTNQPQSQTLQPQSPLTMRQQPSRLEQILSARAGERLQQFGYDQLGVGRQVTVPETGAVQDDYIMGPGDEVVVSLRGQENNDFRTTVDRDGRVVLPRLSPIAATGRSFGSFREDVNALVRRAYIASTASVSLGRVRQISVLVSGEVNVPGQRLVTGLSSAVDAILLSGGVKKSGSLRNIRIQRGRHVYVVDLYSVLTGSGSGSSMRMADGDRIIVPPLGSAVAVAGLVRRPGIYELPAHAGAMTARALLNLAGGQEVRGRYRLAVQRIEPDGRLNLVPLQGESGVVRDSEILRVELGADFASSQATLSGGTGLAGQYAVSSGSRLSDILRAPGALGLTPYTLFGVIVRKDTRTLLRTLVAFTPVAVMNGAEDMQLQSDDLVRPISVAESQLLAFVVKSYLDKMALDQAHIRNPLQSTADNAAAAAAAAKAAGVDQIQTKSPVTPSNPFGLDPNDLQQAFTGQEDFGGVPADIQRSNITALLDTAAPGTVLARQRELAYQMALTQAAAPSAAGIPPATSQLQQSQQSQQSQQTALLLSSQIGTSSASDLSGGFGQNGGLQNGQNQNQNGMNGPGAPQQEPAANYIQQPATATGYASNQEVHTFDELSRQLGVDPLVLVNFLIDHRARLDGAVNGPGPYFIGPNATLKDLVQAAGGTAKWADESGVELLTTAVDGRTGHAASQRQTLPLNQGTLASYVVRPRDQIHFNQVFTDTGIGSVSVQGEVRFGGNYPITRGEHLSDLLMRVGGLTSTAYPAGTVFLRKSAAQVEEQGYKRTANEIQSQLLAGMARIGNDKITGEGFTAIQSFITQLRAQKGLGRIAIAADPSVLAANPQVDPLLEAGDVVFIPQRPSTVTVLGEVMQPGSYSYRPGMTVGDYVTKAGGYAQFSDEDLTFIVLPDGSARKLETSWLGFDATSLPPGSSIVVPRDLAPLTARQVVLDVTGIMSSLAVTIASLAILAKQ
jgi:polysaccharide export outer membrane protein